MWEGPAFVERLGLLRGCILRGQSAPCARAGKCLDAWCILHAACGASAEASGCEAVCGDLQQEPYERGLPRRA